MAPYKLHGKKGPLVLRKSRKLVGLKLNNEEAKDEFIKEEVREHLGGFRVVRLDAENSGLDEKLDEVRQRGDVEVGTHIYYAEGSDRPLVPTGEIAIAFSEGTSEEEQQLVLDEFHLQLKERRSPLFVIAEVTAQSPNPVRAAVAMQSSSLVQLAEPDMDSILDDYGVAPADALLDHQWSLDNRGRLPDSNYRLRFGADAKIVDAWNKLGNLGSSNVTVALIDGGFDLSHPDLKDKVTRPYDFIRNTSRLPQGQGVDTHGTPCATVALAAGNRRGMVGAAPRARFMPLDGKTFSDRITEQEFDYCIRHGVDIISCSWGSIDPAHRLSYRKEQAIARAAREGRNGKGCIILFAAGNEGVNRINHYATHGDVIAVGASTSQDQHAPYSNTGRELTLCAPSSGDWPIIAGRAWWDQGDTRYSGQRRYWVDGVSRGQHYKHFGGTSSATPLVAGVCALMLSANPDLSAKEVREILIDTADRIGSSWEYRGGHSDKYGYGRVNALRAVEEALRRKTTAPPPPVSGGSGGTFEVSVNDNVTLGWGVQIGAYSSYSQVMLLVSQLERRYGQPVHVQSVQSGSRTIYRVIVGSFPTPDAGRSLQQQLRQEGYPGAFLKNLRDV